MQSLRQKDLGSSASQQPEITRVRKAQHSSPAIFYPEFPKYYKREPERVPLIEETGPLCGMGAGIPIIKSQSYLESRVRRIGNSEAVWNPHATGIHRWKKLRKDRDIKK